MVKQKWGCLYRLTNMVNGRVYIGKTVNFNSRMSKHKTLKLKTYISNAIQKYGWENFKQEKIIDDVPEEDLSNLEISYIEVENTLAPVGYNLTVGGEGVSGYKHTDEAIRKMHNGRYGCVTFDKQCKKWSARSASPEGKFIGLYFTKEKAEEALKHYNETGECMEWDRIKRKRGTGTIRKRGKRFDARITINKKTYRKTCDTVAECEEWLKQLKIKYNFS